MATRPVTHFLDNNLIEKIISEARDLLCKLGITLHNKDILDVLSGHGATVDQDKFHVIFTNDITAISHPVLLQSIYLIMKQMKYGSLILRISLITQN